MSEYIGNRIVPRHDGVWDSTKAYEPLIIVYEEGSGDSYISRKDVPAGTGLNQKEYWALCARFSEQVALLREETDGQVAGMQKLTMDTLNTMTQRTEAAEDLINSNKAALEQRMENIEARQDANVSASTDSSADYAAEMVDARVDDTGRTFDSAGSNVRALGKARTFQNLAKSWGWRDNAFVNDAGAVTSSQNWSTLHMVPVTGGSILIHGALSYMSGRILITTSSALIKAGTIWAARSAPRRGMFSTTMRNSRCWKGPVLSQLVLRRETKMGLACICIPTFGRRRS